MSQAAGHAHLLSAGEGLPVGPCARCEREVVAYLLDVAGDAEAYACVHCDGPVRGVELRGEAAVGELGYSIEDPLAAGCGTGCGSGGCGARSRTIDDLLARHRRL
jgi:hypothetical protein